MAKWLTTKAVPMRQRNWKMPKAKSKSQARFFGGIAGGKFKKKGLSRAEAKERVRGVKYKELPEKKEKTS